MIVAKRDFLGICTADYCPDQPWQSKLRAESMADCFAFLGNLTPGYLRQHCALPEVASHRRHYDIYPRSWLLYICHRALVRTFGPKPTHWQFESTQGRWSISHFTACRTMAPQGSASSVFTEFESNGWPTTGLACLVGLNGPVPYLTGADSSVHLAEELKNSAWRLPRSMLVTAITNYITAFVIVGMLPNIISYSTLKC